MSSATDLELQHSLPEIRLRPTVAEEVDNSKAIENSSVNQSDDDNNEDQDCRTPTSDEHKIPVMRSCPPAPKKQRLASSCKRKLADELRFFEIVGRDEIESFFRSAYKKRCCSNSNVNCSSNNKKKIFK